MMRLASSILPGPASSIWWPKKSKTIVSLAANHSGREGRGQSNCTDDGTILAHIISRHMTSSESLLLSASNLDGRRGHGGQERRPWRLKRSREQHPPKP